MASFNKVILLGNLTRDPELRYTPKGTAVARLGLAVNRRYTGENNQTVEEVTFLDVDAWGKSAELIAQYLRKGNPIFIEGRLKLDQWDDKNTGQKVSKLKVVLESFQFVGGKGGEGGPGGAPSSPAPRPARPSAPAPAPSAPPAGGSDFDGPPPEDDDVPF
ncbi:MAG TPA: single-stranded DNA-binding protein [Candidatus Limnocylindria bacterium]|nr:single-stranded DNA-binding protein [Candidatus Limnocylindria bacterium]